MLLRRLGATLWWACAGAACGTERGDAAAASTPDIEPAVLTDVNPDPAIVEVSIVAAPTTVEYLSGKATPAWGYRDGARAGGAPSIPGPALRARRGDQIIVHFRNELPEPTTVHWHGIRLEAEMDGSTSVQTPIPPNGAFDYRFRAIDAGTFWYHPHVRASEQIERGLHAPLVVSFDDGIDVTRERTFVLDDVKVASSGDLVESDTLDLMVGRQGNLVLANGRTGARIAVERGSRERWRLVNAANGRYFTLRLAGHRFTVIGVDGGLLPAPSRPVETLTIAPGERYDVLVTFDGPPGTEATLETIHHDRGHDLPDPGPKPLVEVTYRGQVARAPAPLPGVLSAYEALPVTSTTPVRRFVLGERDARDGPVFSINGETWPFTRPVVVARNVVEVWEVESSPAMDHPFHLHGMFFQPLGADGRPDPARGWKDTVNVPRGSRVRFAVRYDPPGMWMFHCHILEHAERGMMGDLMVMP